MKRKESDVSGNRRDAWFSEEALSAIRLSIPVTIILERRMISRSFWSLPSWYLHTVAVGSNLIAGAKQTSVAGMPAGSTDKGDLFAWRGFEVTLYKDACERYWHALIGDKPLIYVVCRDDSEHCDADQSGSTPQAMSPVTVTIDYDDASAAAETDAPVLSAPIPGELYHVMERFVLAHYKPQAFKKRKRRNWSGDAAPEAGNSGDGREPGSGHE